MIYICIHQIRSLDQTTLGFKWNGIMRKVNWSTKGL